MNDSLSSNTIKQNTDDKEVINLLTIYKIEIYLMMGKGYSRGIQRIPRSVRERLIAEACAIKNSKGHYVCSKRNAWNYFQKTAKRKMDELKVSSYDELYYVYSKNNCL